MRHQTKNARCGFRFQRLIAIFACNQKEIRMKHIAYLFALILLAASCNSKPAGYRSEWSEARNEAEAGGRKFLQKAREAFARADFHAARVQLDSIRVRHALALEARECGIVLLDSINLGEAQRQLSHTDSLLTAGSAGDSLRAAFEEQANRVKFYARKLANDRSKQKRR